MNSLEKTSHYTRGYTVVNTEDGSPSHFSNKSCQLIVMLEDIQFIHVNIK